MCAFKKITPEQAGITSKTVTGFIRKLESRGLAMHGVMFIKGDSIFAEGYWKPFNKDCCHRLYSETKSFVSVAIGLLAEEGKLSLTDKIVDYFKDKVDGELPNFLENQTITDMLTMRTVGAPGWWFSSGDKDRTHFYINDKRKTHPSGSFWSYDSTGSQVLCSLVERLSGKTLLEYLKDKIFDKIGAFKTAKTLKTPNGETWGDSSMICTLKDVATFARFVMNYGVYNGERLMNADYLKTATSKIVDNSGVKRYGASEQGYGYQIWRVCGNGFAFIGMGDQLTVCYPEKDLIFACIADNQGDSGFAKEYILTNLEEMFVNKISDVPLKEDENAYLELSSLLNGLTLFAVKGKETSPVIEKINGVEYLCENNNMGIKRFKFVFNGKGGGKFIYENSQGNKEIPFGINKNVFGNFPQYGYSNEYGALPSDSDFTYKCATSLALLDDDNVKLHVQIIDNYLGNMTARFSFNGEYSYAVFVSNAENFLNEYQGAMVAKK